jgi:hypothetical protein
MPLDDERRRRQGQSDIARSRVQRWADLPEEERRRRQSQSDSARERAAREVSLPANERRRRRALRDTEQAGPQRTQDCGQPEPTAEAAELENDQTLQAMWDTVENGGYDFMSKGDW